MSCHDIYNLNKHLSCSSFTDNNRMPLIETIELAEGRVKQLKGEKFEVVFVLSGTIDLYREGYGIKTITKSRLFLLPPGVTVSLSAVKDATLMVCTLTEAVGTCRRMDSDEYTRSSDSHDDDLYPLAFKKPVAQYAGNLAACVKSGLRCERYLICKYTELMILLSNYYPDDELARFLRPSLGADIPFRARVLRSLRPGMNSVRELADRCHMSEVGFRRRFKKEFGLAPKEYILKRTKVMILNELKSGRKSNKDIVAEYGFNSPSTFTYFCVKYFGDTPTALRKK